MNIGLNSVILELNKIKITDIDKKLDKIRLDTSLVALATNLNNTPAVSSSYIVDDGGDAPSSIKYKWDNPCSEYLNDQETELHVVNVFPDSTRGKLYKLIHIDRDVPTRSRKLTCIRENCLEMFAFVGR